MAKLVYAALTSLDGYIEDEEGRFDWAVPDDATARRSAVSTGRTRLEREFDPEAVRRLKHGAERDLSVSGPGLAQDAFRAGLVDEVHLFLFPVVVGGGKPGLPRNLRLDLELLDERRFGNGVVHLHHRVR
jgi:dihydrofolate reductase